MGGKNSEIYQYLCIKLKKCKGTVIETGNACKSDSALAEFYRTSSLSFNFVQSYFDGTDYKKKIHYFIDDQVQIDLEADRKK